MPFNLLPGIKLGSEEKLLLIAGPCQIESAEHCIMIAQKIQELCRDLPLQIVFKSSFDKANRSSLTGMRGPGIEAGLSALAKVKEVTKLPVLTDIHSPEQASLAAEVVDVLQIPAFLCRQTDLLLAAGATGKPINCKKGQFMHPADMRFVVDKIRSTGNEKIMLCERGTSFGYRDLVFDPRSIEIMRSLGYPIIFDGTHSVQSLGGSSGQSGGQTAFTPVLVKAAAALGIDGIFIECHEDPKRAPSDSASMLPISELRATVEAACRIRQAALNVSR